MIRVIVAVLCLLLIASALALPAAEAGSLPDATMACSISPPFLHFGRVYASSSAEQTFIITNEGVEAISGTVTTDSEQFSIIDDTESFFLTAGQSHTVRVRFKAISIAPRTCMITVGDGCGEIPASANLFDGEGAIALHVSPPPPGGCANAPIIPCSAYETEWPVGQPATVWLVGTSKSLQGIGGLSCGIEYDPANFVDWTLCASGLEYPSDGGNGLWPAPLGGNQITWAGETDCQTTEYGEEGVHAVAGAFYVYAYSPDLFRATMNYSAVGNPGLFLLDCGNMPYSLSYPEAVGAVGFGGVDGHNPCICSVSQTSLNFGTIYVGRSASRSFTITNEGAETLVGTVTESSAEFSIAPETESYSLAPGESHTVTVRFTPTTGGSHACTILVPGGCADVPATGTALPVQAVIAVHASAHNFKTSDCDVAPQIPCGDYTAEWPVGQSADIWLVAVSNVLPGIGGLSCGVNYEDGSRTGESRENGVGLDVYEWTLCTSGLEFPNSTTGAIADEWPASGGGNRITWNTSTDCQTTEYGGYGIHAVAGFFYVYAYSPDVFQIITNDNLVSGPELVVGTCDNLIYDLPNPEAAGAVGFGGVEGYNPCLSAVPVRLLSFTAERVDTGAEVRWTVAGADEDHLGFDVYRGFSGDDRIEVSAGMLSGRETYVFVDDNPPSTAVKYWLAERSRAGTTTWHGPVELAAATMPRRGLMLHHASPNPFFSATAIAFRTGTDGPVTVRIFDTSGRQVAQPFTGQLPAGDHEIAWDGRDTSGQRASAGIYFYRVATDQGGGSGKVVLIR